MHGYDVRRCGMRRAHGYDVRCDARRANGAE